MGLSALALESNPVWPTYPNRLSADDVSAGLVLPNAAVALLGKGGAAATLLIVFFAVTSALSSERESSITVTDKSVCIDNGRCSNCRIVHLHLRYLPDLLRS